LMDFGGGGPLQVSYSPNKA